MAGLFCLPVRDTNAVRAGALLAVLMASVADCHGQLRYTGVNLAGAEFGEGSLPGNFNQHYIYPNATEVDYFMGKGMNTFRVPFRWERLQREQFADLHAMELSRMDAFVNYATSQGAHVILDPHNFARYYPQPTGGQNYQTATIGRIGNDVPYEAFADFWYRVADHYKDNHRVFFNLMNEPNSMPTADWVTASNAAIEAIRETGATNLILVPGNQWTGAWAWNETWYMGANSVHMLNIVDPLNNFAFDAHQYLDSNSSGGSPQVVDEDIGQERLVTFTNWLKSHNLKGFLGEFAVANSTIGNGPTQIGDEALQNMLGYIEDNSDVWLGWAWWAAGPWWGNYMFTLEPTNLGQANQGPDRAAMAVLQQYLANPIPGDYNLDGVVDAADYTLWRDTLGQTGVALAADSRANGIVDEHDFEMWKASFGGASGGAAASTAAVPEASAGVLFVAAAFTLSFVRRRLSWRAQRQQSSAG